MSHHRLRRVLARMLDETEFLSPYGIRSLSRVHREHPYTLRLDGSEYRVDYEPAESQTGWFGGNSNWRGPVWFPVNYLIVESLQRSHEFLGDRFRVECPTGSGRRMNLREVSVEVSRRLTSIFLRDEQGRRPVYGAATSFSETRIGATCCRSSNIFTAMTAAAWGRVIRPGGRDWSRPSFRRAGASV